MRTNCLKALLLGAVTLFSVTAVVSCNNKDIEDLQTRVTVLEGMIQELQSDLQNAMVTGATILNATQDAKGVWTLSLSDGKTITIAPSSAAGSAVEVQENADAFVITVNGTAYAIPKVASAAINSLVYCPSTTAVPNIEETLDVFFLATPALTADQVSASTFDIADAREVATKAGANLFKVDAVAVDGDLLKVTIKCLAATAGKTYTVALKAVVGGTAISSNYFFLEVGSGHSFDPENLQTPTVPDGTQLFVLDGDLTGYHRVLIPNSAKNFVQGFKLTDYLTNLPKGATFQLAPQDLQNDNVKNNYGKINAALSSDGTWSLQERLGTDCWNSDGKNGIIIYTIVNDQIIHKIFWQIDNPIPGMGLDKWLGNDFPEAQHLEVGTEPSVNLKWIVPAGAGRIDMAKLFLTAQFPEGELLDDPIYLRHGQANKAIQMIQDASVMDGDDELFGNDGSKFIFGDKLTSLCKYSRGMVWRTTQPSWVSSIRENWSDDQKALANGECNGEIIGGWDGSGDIPGLMGWYFDDKGLNFTDAYEGWGFRTGVGVYFEYDLGEQTIGPWHWCYMFINRRVAPYAEGKGIDPNSR